MLMPVRHAWVETGSALVDITADQFGLAPVVIALAVDDRYRLDTDTAHQDFQKARVAAETEEWTR